LIKVEPYIEALGGARRDESRLTNSILTNRDSLLKRLRCAVAILDDSGTGPGTRALEIGCGTGQATLPLARRGYRLLGVELGANLAAVARTKLADYTNARVLACSFEAWPVEQEAFDLVVSATAFHWVDPRVRYRKSAQALRPDGSLALIWNRADTEGGSEGFLEALEDVHRRA